MLHWWFLIDNKQSDWPAVHAVIKIQNNFHRSIGKKKKHHVKAPESFGTLLSSPIKSCQVPAKAKSALWQLIYLTTLEIFKYILDMPNEKPFIFVIFTVWQKNKKQKQTRLTNVTAVLWILEVCNTSISITRMHRRLRPYTNKLTRMTWVIKQTPSNRLLQNLHIKTVMTINSGSHPKFIEP